jgi:hypothetical protein
MLSGNATEAMRQLWGNRRLYGLMHTFRPVDTAPDAGEGR